jgi:type I restriction enzyme R subunit
LFADPSFDGDPTFESEAEINDQGEELTNNTLVDSETEEEEEVVGDIDPHNLVDDTEPSPRKFYFDGGSVEIAAHLVYELDPDGRQLRVVKFTEYTAEKVRTLYTNAAQLRLLWSSPDQRSAVIDALAERGIDFDSLAEAANLPDADPFDLLCHIAFNAPLRTRRERAQRLRTEKKDFFDRFLPEARLVLEELLEKYAEHGQAQFVLPDILKVPPISEKGNVTEISNLFGGAEKLRAAVNDLQTLLYAA